jgi:triosephosphate isomerase
MIPAMRPVIVAGNWKMHTTPADAGELARTIATRTRVDGVIRVLCPPFVCLAAVRDALDTPDVTAPDGTGVEVGAQDVHHEPAGAYTGWISAPMLQGLATWTIVGHSERRRDAGETDEIIGRKLLAARAHGLRTILCVGEHLHDHEAGRAFEVVDRQLRGCLAEADPARLGMDGDRPWLTIAYEPVWAIGTGRTARGSDAAEMAAGIRRTLGELGFGAYGEDVPILYGGSVTAAVIDEFMAEPGIDGALVGGASLKPDEMAGIVARAGLTAAARAEAAGRDAARQAASTLPR